MSHDTTFRRPTIAFRTVVTDENGAEQNLTYIFHLAQSVNSDHGVDVSHKTTHGGKRVQEKTRESPAKFSCRIRCAENNGLLVPYGDTTGSFPTFTQKDLPIQSQLRTLLSLKGQLVLVLTRTIDMYGIVDRVTIDDDMKHDNAVDVDVHLTEADPLASASSLPKFARFSNVPSIPVPDRDDVSAPGAAVTRTSTAAINALTQAEMNEIRNTYHNRTRGRVIDHDSRDNLGGPFVASYNPVALNEKDKKEALHDKVLAALWGEERMKPGFEVRDARDNVPHKMPETFGLYAYEDDEHKINNVKRKTDYSYVSVTDYRVNLNKTTGARIFGL